MSSVNKTGLNLKQLHEGKQDMFPFKGRNFIYMFVAVFQRTSHKNILSNNSVQFYLRAELNSQRPVTESARIQRNTIIIIHF
jgi:hypothetical protein